MITGFRCQHQRPAASRVERRPARARMRSGRMPVRWILVSVVIVALLDQTLEPMTGPSGPAAALYLWTYGSSVLAHLAFFDLPGSGARWPADGPARTAVRRSAVAVPAGGTAAAAAPLGHRTAVIEQLRGYRSSTSSSR